MKRKFFGRKSGLRLTAGPAPKLGKTVKVQGLFVSTMIRFDDISTYTVREHVEIGCL